jgi:hypothetical protein
MSQRRERCDKCKWWVEYPPNSDGIHYHIFEDNDATGHCHRFPPKHNMIMQIAASSEVDEAGDPERLPEYNYDWAWPATVSGDFCGEFAPRDVDAVPKSLEVGVDELRSRIANLQAEDKALRVLLRSAIAKERTRDRLNRKKL